MKKNQALLLLLVGMCSGLGRATTVVAIWTPTRIIIAADSKRVSLDGKVGRVCKIRREGPILYAVAGLFSDGITDFSVPDIADKTFATWNKHPENGTFGFNELFTSDLSIALARTKQTLTEAVRKNPNFNYADTVVAGFDHERLRVVYQRSNISASKLRILPDDVQTFAFIGDEFVVIPQPGESEPHLVVAGVRDEIFAYTAQHPEWTKMDPVEAARKFVQLEIEAHGDVVDYPITIYAIEKDGAITPIEPRRCEPLNWVPPVGAATGRPPFWLLP